MANKVQRGEAMDQSIIMRCTPSDKINIELEASKRGMNMSQMIRDIMVQQKIIEPTYPIQF
jgi:predicted DNA binding CopG/RHH family protein